MYDIVFLSYDEPQADTNYRNLLDRFPVARRVHGIKGIDAAHEKASKISLTKWFWVVDADVILREDFDFSFKVADHQSQYAHIWMSYNPYIKDMYGYSGVKLLSKAFFKNKKPFLDFTTSLGAGVVYHPQISCDVNFDSDPNITYRSTFREAFKLSKATDEESLTRLEKWKNGWVNSKFPDHFKSGVEDGIAASSSIDINDFDYFSRNKT